MCLYMGERVIDIFFLKKKKKTGSSILNKKLNKFINRSYCETCIVGFNTRLKGLSKIRLSIQGLRVSTFFQMFIKSKRDKRHSSFVFDKWAKSTCGKEASYFESMLRGVKVSGKTKKNLPPSYNWTLAVTGVQPPYQPIIRIVYRIWNKRSNFSFCHNVFNLFFNNYSYNYRDGRCFLSSHFQSFLLQTCCMRETVKRNILIQSLNIFCKKIGFHSRGSNSF